MKNASENTPQVTLRINKKVFLFLTIGIFIGFLVVFLLQLNQPVSCNVIFPRTVEDDSYKLTEYNKQYEQYLWYKKQEIDSLKALYFINENYQSVNKNLNDWDKINEKESTYKFNQGIFNSRDKYAAGRPFSYSPCFTQAYTLNYQTFFGNNVRSDKDYYNLSYEVTKLDSSEFSSNLIGTMNTDRYVEISQSYNPNCGYPPNYSVITKYRMFEHSFTQCDCETTQHKLFVKLKGMLVDYIPAVIIGLILTGLMYLVWKFKFKIKITG